jgi:hypothetical protein
VNKVPTFAITDLGQPLRAVAQDGTSMHIPRYGVWQVRDGVLADVVETGDDLEALKAKYDTATVLVIVGRKP